MESIKGIGEVRVPVFCPDCRRRDTFIRQPERDVRTETGKVLEAAYCCLFCGYVAYSYSCLDIWEKKV